MAHGPYEYRTLNLKAEDGPRIGRHKMPENTTAVGIRYGTDENQVLELERDSRGNIRLSAGDDPFMLIPNGSSTSVDVVPVDRYEVLEQLERKEAERRGAG